MPTTDVARSRHQSAMHTSFTGNLSRARNPTSVPALSQLVKDGRADAVQHGRRTREALDYWFRQSERLNIARDHYELRGARFTDFARRIGVDRASAFQLLKLHKHRAAVIAHCRREQAKATRLGETYFHPGWRAALEEFEVKPPLRRSSAYGVRTGTSSADAMPKVFLYEGDNLTLLRSISGPIQADVCITSPPYFQKFDYQHEGQYGLEGSVSEYLRVQVAVFHEVQRLLRDGGTCFIVIGDTSNNYSPIRSKSQRKGRDKQWLTRRSLAPGYREKEVLNVPFRLAEALRGDGWVHRATLVWDKMTGSTVANSDATPESHEYVLHMIKWASAKRRPYGNTTPLKSSVLRHMAVAHPEHGCVFPVSLVEELLSVCPAEPIILDPYIGSGTVALAAKSIPGAVVHGCDLDCSVARDALPHSSCFRGYVKMPPTTIT